VQLAGEFTEWDKHPVSMRKQRDGTWKAEVTLPPGEHEYKFLVDGEWRDDENCATHRPNGYGGENCIRVVR
jgi:1,4-alpha-glucan branching enzyme